LESSVIVEEVEDLRGSKEVEVVEVVEKRFEDMVVTYCEV
jgi:hypothetical protein